MKMKTATKRISAVLLGLVLALTMTACQQRGRDEEVDLKKPDREITQDKEKDEIQTIEPEEGAADGETQKSEPKREVATTTHPVVTDPPTPQPEPETEAETTPAPEPETEPQPEAEPEPQPDAEASDAPEDAGEGEEGGETGEPGGAGEGEGDGESFEPQTVRIGVIGENNEPWEGVRQNLEGTGIEIELVKFSDYLIPNAALNEGDIDLNSFQHRLFLENEIKSENYDIQEIGVTILAPLTLYSEKYDSLDQIPEGGIIAIPSDPTNSGRSLKLLEEAGFLKMKPEVGYMGTKADILENPMNLEILPVEASMTAVQLPDVDAAIINAHHAATHGLTPAKDGLISESVDLEHADQNPFINVIVARSEDADNPVYKKIVEAYQQDNVAEIIYEAYKGAQIPAWDGAPQIELPTEEEETTPEAEEPVEEAPAEEEGETPEAEPEAEAEAPEAEEPVAEGGDAADAGEGEDAELEPAA